MAISGITDTTSLTNLVNSNLSEDLKLKGANKIGQIISDQGNKISTLMLPLALNFAGSGVTLLTVVPKSTFRSERTLLTILDIFIFIGLLMYFYAYKLMTYLPL